MLCECSNEVSNLDITLISHSLLEQTHTGPQSSFFWTLLIPTVSLLCHTIMMPLTPHMKY